MSEVEFVYLIGVLVGMCSVYISLFFAFQKIFNQKEKTRMPNKESLRSLLLITLISIITYFICFYVLDNEFIGNRLLHAVGGGFVGFMMCLFAIKDSGIYLSNKKIIITGFIIITVLGVFNEFAEYYLQSVFDFVLAPSPTDTVLDLISNSVGYFLASIYLVSRKSKA